MTVFITHALKNAALEALAPLGRWFVGWSLCLLLAGASAAAPTAVTQLRTERADEGIYLSALVQFNLPAVVEDALLKGIPAFFVIEADIYRDRWYWTNPRVASAARTLRLAYQPLTRRWRVNIVPGLITSSGGLRATLSQHYETLPEALSAVQRIARWKIADAADLDPHQPYLLDLKFRLDLSQLPRPFQIGVAGQRDWTIAAQVKDQLRLEPVAPVTSAAPASATPTAPATPVAPAAPATSAIPAAPATSAMLPALPTSATSAAPAPSTMPVMPPTSATPAASASLHRYSLGGAVPVSPTSAKPAASATSAAPAMLSMPAAPIRPIAPTNSITFTTPAASAEGRQ